ncbi:MAG: hypothetical protein JWO94_319 [Verrucomicrobiaceae bacterium]|nr:hypothetical protein [Verrucomicrobiaceae bacterium]
MSNFSWSTTFRELFDRCAKAYDAGKTDFSLWFNAADKAFLASIGYREREFFDFIEDHCGAGEAEPTAETALLIASVRRDYLNVVQHGTTSDKIVAPSALPAKSAELGGYRWLPRIIVKARSKLRGEMDPDTMFGCGGDRAFLSAQDIHPADFLREVWAAGDDDSKILAYVKAGGRRIA